MATFTPNTNVQLYAGVPLSPTYNDTVDFPTKVEQENYFERYLLVQYTDFTYQREQAAILVDKPYDEVISVNYCRYQNSNFGVKWFYAFVTRIEYVNPNCSRLYIEQDVMQTWMFDYTFLPSFIEREHTKSDWPFEHNIPEGLEFGPIKTGYSVEKGLNEMAIVLAYSPANINKAEKGELHAGVYSGVRYKYFPATAEGVTTLNNYIEQYSAGGYLDDILSIFMVPYMVANNRAINFYMGTYPNTVDGYIPRNKKLFSYPYRYLAVDNHAGQEAIYRFELFKNPSAIWFNIAANYNMETACWAYPMDYAGQTENWDEGVSLANFPQCTWNGNIYANWLSRNKLSLGMQNIQLGVGVISGIAGGAISGAAQGALGGIGGVPGAVLGGAVGAISPILNIGDVMAQRGDKSLYPNKLMGQENNSTVNVAWGRVGYLFKIMVITQEYAKILDDYFDRFGYKVNRNGTPDRKTRNAWNYLKTVDCKIQGSFPADHIVQIQNIYDRGITIWHGGNVGDYSQANDCVDPGPHPTWEPPTVPPPPPMWEPSKPEPLGWGWPAIGWSKYKVTSGYGYRWIDGERKWHDGVDIAIPNKTPLLACHAGKVMYIGKNDIRGRYIDISFTREDGTAAFYRYQHMDDEAFLKLGLSVGDNIELEQQIGAVGWSGYVIPSGVRGAHLHMELHFSDASGQFYTVDPLPYLVPNYS